MVSSRAAVLVRLLFAGLFLTVAVLLVVRGSRDQAPADASTDARPSASPAPPPAAPTVSAAPAATAEDAPSDVDAVERVDAAADAPSGPEWRVVAGVARRADTGFPTGVRLAGVDAKGGRTPTRSSHSFGGFTGRVSPETVAIVFTPRSTDLREVRVPLRPGEDWTTLDVVLPVARGVLRARVIDERGDGVPGVVVAAGGARRTTDDRGNVHFRPLRDDTYAVWLTNVPFSTYGTSRRSVRLSGGAPNEPVVFVVPRGATLRGSVVEEGTEAPVGGVDVVLTRPGARGSHRAARSDDRGFFEFLGLVPGPYRIAATASDGVHGRLVLDLDPLARDEVRTVVLTLSVGAGSMIGRALDEDDEPVPFAAIEARRAGDGGTERLSTRTDSHGRFHLRSLPAGTWSVGPAASYCRTHNWVEGAATAVTVHPGEEADVRIRLRSGSFLEGQVVSTSERRHLLVRLHLDDEHVLERSVGQQGRFAIGGVRPGTYLVEAIDPSGEGSVALASQMVYVAAGENTNVRLEVP